jgi:hypothetical protein
MMPDCYRCKWRRDLVGSAHSRCVHPSIVQVSEEPLGNMFAMLASVGRVPPMVVNPRILNIKADKTGISRGWFNFPWDYDPVWLRNCDGFEAKTG